jgi:hypothetical protein
MLTDAGIAYTKVISENNVDLVNEYGVKMGGTLVVVSNGTFTKYENGAALRQYIKSVKQ